MDTSLQDGCTSIRTWNRDGWFDLEVKLWFQELGQNIIKSFAGASRGIYFHSGWQVLITKNDHNSIHSLYSLYVYKHTYIKHMEWNIFLYISVCVRLIHVCVYRIKLQYSVWLLKHKNLGLVSFQILYTNSEQNPVPIWYKNLVLQFISN